MANVRGGEIPLTHAEFDLLATPTVSTVAFAAEGPLPFEIDGESTPGSEAA